MPEPDTDASLAESGNGAEQDFPAQSPSQSTAPCKQKTWVGVELVDQDGKPVAGENYRLQLPDGRIIEGKLDDKGTAGVTGIDPGDCKICFPRLDGHVWRPL